MGELAITLESMLHRDGRSMEETLPVIRRRWPELSRTAVEDVARQLPPRMKRPREVPIEDAARIAASDSIAADARRSASDRTTISQTISGVVRTTFQDLQGIDRDIFRRRFENGMSIADIARALRVDQKPLYRRIQQLLRILRDRLHAAGVSSEDVADIVDHGDDLDFGFDSEPKDPSDRLDETAEEGDS